MPHMPSTGVSGVDLYSKSIDGKWLWNRGRFKFSDTIIFSFYGLPNKELHHNKGRQYKLYLPLYNEVEWLEIGTEQNSIFTPNTIRKEKPINKKSYPRSPSIVSSWFLHSFDNSNKKG